MKAVAKIIAYFAGVVVLGAALAPLLYWGVHALEPWFLANGWLRWEPLGDQVIARGPLAFLQADFTKYFHRAVLLAALILLWPVLRWLDASFAALRLPPDLRRGAHFTFGLVVGGGVVAAMAAGYLFYGYYHLKPNPPWPALAGIAVSALAVAALEEALFRGAIFGLLARAMKPFWALFWTTLLFASLHFLRPGDEAPMPKVTWLSGFELLPDLFHQFGDPLLLLSGFTTIFVLGWVLGFARLRTESLWMGIGLHAGVVFVKMGFAKLTKRDGIDLPWVGPELQIGLVPVALLLFALFLIWRRVEAEELLPNPRPRR